MTRWLTLAWLLIAVSLSACGGPTYAYRYRTTVEVMTKSGLRSASSVQGYSTYAPSELMGSMAVIQSRLRGEAAIVDLGEGRVLIATLRPWSGHGTTAPQDLGADFWDPTKMFLARQGLNGNFRKEHSVGLAQFVRRPASGPIAVAFDQGPVLLAYNPRKAKHFVIVEDQDLTTVLGPDVRLKRLTVAVTKDPVGHGDFEHLMPGLLNQPGYIVASSQGTGLLVTFEDEDFARQ